MKKILMITILSLVSTSMSASYYNSKEINIFTDSYIHLKYIVPVKEFVGSLFEALKHMSEDIVHPEIRENEDRVGDIAKKTGHSIFKHVCNLPKAAVEFVQLCCDPDPLGASVPFEHYMGEDD